jgi:hypothetical protein
VEEEEEEYLPSSPKKADPSNRDTKFRVRNLKKLVLFDLMYFLELYLL